MSSNTVLSSPIPPYQNLPIHAEFYKPKKFVISNVTLGSTTIITTNLDMDYVIGQEVRLIIPSSFGCTQLNEVSSIVISIPSSNQVELQLDSLRNVDAFISSSATTKPQILSIGDVNSGVINSSGRRLTGTFIPGSFINISPL